MARSTTLLGPWRKFAGNPILRSGNGWRCPGHADIAADGAGTLTAVFHAYRAGDGFMAGRQLLTAPLTFGIDGWPQIGDGRPPPPVPGAASLAFTDDFTGALAPEWEWPLGRVPGRRTGAGGLTLRAPLRERDGKAVGRRLDGGVLARRLGTDSYTATAVLDRSSLDGDAAGGLSSYKNANELIGLAVNARRAVVWQRSKGRGTKLLFGAATPRGTQVHLRMLARGRRFTFHVSPDGVTWKRVGRPVRSPVTETARFVLTAGGERRARVRFLSAAVGD